MNNRTTDELIRFAGENIMGYEWLDIKPIVHDDEDDEGDFLDSISYKGWRRKSDGVLIYSFEPLTDSNQLELIEAELVKLGFRFKECKDDTQFTIYIELRKPNVGKWLIHFDMQCKYDIAQIRQMRLTAYVEAHRKLNEGDSDE